VANVLISSEYFGVIIPAQPECGKNKAILTNWLNFTGYLPAYKQKFSSKNC
jgi:hypothetical protein